MCMFVLFSMCFSIFQLLALVFSTTTMNYLFIILPIPSNFPILFMCQYSNNYLAIIVSLIVFLITKTFTKYANNAVVFWVLPLWFYQRCWYRVHLGHGSPVSVAPYPKEKPEMYWKVEPNCLKYHFQNLLIYIHILQFVKIDKRSDLYQFRIFTIPMDDRIMGYLDLKHEVFGCDGF